MIPNAVLHLAGEQPLLVDLDAFPAPTDTALRCRNVRYMNGKRPVFIERPDAVCLFPMVMIRFIEIPDLAPRTSLDGELPAGVAGDAGGSELDVDEDFLRRIREA